jgi:hypothetical protein
VSRFDQQILKKMHNVKADDTRLVVVDKIDKGGKRVRYRNTHDGDEGLADR